MPDLDLPRGPLAELRLGRAADCHVVVDDPSVSRWHAVVRGAPGRWTVTDAGSRNGTWVGHVALTPHHPHALRDGDRLRLGAVTLVVTAPGETDQDEEATSAIATDDLIAARARLSHYQLQVVRLLCEPWQGGAGEPASNVEIAERLGTPDAVDAVKAALRRAYANAGLTDAPAGSKRRLLCRKATEQGWV